ncbi:unnamed protein product [Peronospora farinosa]|uniref:Mid2 domain-containing protein n=1 Tax=Peronospora farinosa TaxID=134698 RepID=A0ABN8CCD5_9STRA|nr:unnamed protein product [Peronospora farinosa]
MTDTCRCRCRTNVRRVYRCGWSSAVWLPIVATLLLVNEAAGMSTASSFVMDGATTYCWEVDTSIYSNTVDGSSVKMVSAEGNGCPLKLLIAFPTKDVYVYESVDVSWNAKMRVASDGSFEPNAFGLTVLSTGLDRISQNNYEIISSRLRTCLYGVDCNPVTTGSQLTENTTNIPLNFTDGLASFDSSELSFDQPGKYTLLAHLILPSNKPTSKRYDYAVFLNVQVLSHSGAEVDTTATPFSGPSEDSGRNGLSSVIIYTLIVGGIVVAALGIIGFVTMRSKIDRKPEAGTSKYQPKKSGGMFGFSNTGVHSSGGAAVASDEDVEEFAMLSMDEATIRQNHGSAYLSALNRKRRSDAAPPQKKVSPIQFAGPVGSLDRKSALAENESFITGDITPHSVSIDIPVTGRANYVGMENTPKIVPPNHSPFTQPSSLPGRILFNDISEDEVTACSRSGIVVGTTCQSNLADTTVSDVTDLNLTAVSERIKQHCAIAEQEASLSSVPMKQDVLTADDLRESETKGPMELSDLLASRVKK